MIMAVRGTPMPMPTLADPERPDEDAGIEVGIVMPEFTAVLVELRDANAVDAVNAVAPVDEVDAVNAVDIEGVEDMIEACPSVTRFSESLQQVSLPISP